jgi:hypothetical protein
MLVVDVGKHVARTCPSGSHRIPVLLAVNGYITLRGIVTVGTAKHVDWGAVQRLYTHPEI